MNRVPIDNAILKLQYNGAVGVSSIGKKSVVFVEMGGGAMSAVSIAARRISAKGYCQISARCGHYKWMLQQDGAPSHTTRPEALCKNLQLT